MVTHVVKRTGHTEPFSASKLHDSVHRACLSVRVLEGEARLLADRITHTITEWALHEIEITSYELRVRIATQLRAFHTDAAYAYETLDSVL